MTRMSAPTFKRVFTSPLCALLLVGCLGKNDTVLRPDPDTATNSVEATPAAADKRMAQNAAGFGTATNPTATSQAGANGGDANARSAGNMPSSDAAGGASSQADAGARAEVPMSQSQGGAGEASRRVDASLPLAGSGGSANPVSNASMTDAGQSALGGPQDADCDLNGVWIGRQITVSEAIGVSAFSNNWYYLEFKQSGSTAEVVKHFDCGIEVLGAVTVVLERPALEAQLTHNLQAGRKLSMSKDGQTCRLESGRFWSIRGADETRYLPGGVRDSETNIREAATSLPLPTAEQTDGALDPDGDGVLGLAFEISGLLSGTRNSVQRDWTRWFTESGYELAPATDWTSDLTIRADFDNEESVLAPVDSLLSSGSTPKATAKHTLRLRFLGRDMTDPRVTAIVKADQVETCYAIQDALPAEELK